MATGVVDLTDANFKQEIAGDTPVFVDFWASWCAPCRSMTPLVEQLAGELGDKVRVCKMDTESNPETPSEYGITGIPAFLVFQKGELKGRAMGAMRYDALKEFVQQYL
ncbi:MAG: thioredoxin [Planctomycetes bacterium]|nr:thioredoxin [Planctomycetota bacterium]